MVSVERTFTVQRPIEQVVEYLADFAHTEQWDPGTKTCTRTDGLPLQVGSRWDNTSEFLGRETELVYRLERWEPDHLVFVGENSSATTTDDLTFTAPTPQSTEIRYHADFDFHGVAALAGPLMKPALAKLADETVQQMTRTLESL